MKEDLEKILKIFTARNVEITNESELEKDLDLDSLDMIELVFYCEDAFNIEIDEEKFLDAVTTVQDVINFIEKVKQE